MLRKYARYFRQAFSFGGKHPPVSRDDIQLLIHDDGIDETELAERRAKLLNLLLVVGAGVPCVWDKAVDIHLFKSLCGLH